MPAPIHELVTQRSVAHGNTVAVSDGAGRLTYAQLDAAAERLADVLAATGVRPGDTVGVLLDRGTAQVVALLAVWKAGAAWLPCDPAHPWERIRAQLAETRATAVLADTSRDTDGIPVVLVDGDGAAEGPPRPRRPRVAVTGDLPAYVLYTSGSTGRPKGVVVGHQAIASVVTFMTRQYAVSDGDRMLYKSALAFDAAIWEIFTPLVSGATVVIAPPGAERDPAALTGMVAEHAVTMLQVVPSALRLLVTEPDWARCRALRLLFSGGEQLPADLARRFLEAVEPAGGDVTVVNLYGLTECAVNTTVHEYDPLQRTGPVPIGGPVDGARLVIRDGVGHDADEGELYIGGAGLAYGYAGRPVLTAERFLPAPDGKRLYRTGDLVRRRADGSLEYRGRTDFQTKINGIRIEPDEIATVLAEHPAVAQAAVVAYHSATGEKRLAAYVRAGVGELPDLRAHLAERLPATHLPAAFVVLDEFPLTASGKIDRSALPAPGAETAGGTAGTATELAVAGVWRELLGVADVGADDDFYQLGGSSLQLVRLANRLREVTGADVALASLLSATTVRAQARLLAEWARPAAPLRRVERGGPLPLSFGQRRLWLLDRLAPGHREWVSGQFLPVPAETDVDEVRAALDALAERHEALLTRFVVVDGEPMQVVEPGRRVPCAIHDVRPEEMPAIADAEIERGFALDREPAVRALLFRLPGGACKLMLLVHHILFDGWSAAIVARDFAEFLAGRGAGLPHLPVQYADFAAWQRDRAGEDVVERELGHWRTMLAGATPLELRTDRRRPPARDAAGAVVPFTLPAETVAPLLAIGREAGATPFATLLTVFATLLARYTAQWDVVIGTPVAGRDRPELENVVGFFLNNLVLRCRLDPGYPFARAVSEVRDMCRVAFVHQDVPFDRLVAELAQERDLSRTPLFQVAFDLHDESLTGPLDDPADLGLLLEVSRTAKTDLTLYLRARPDGSYAGVLEYASGLFEEATMARLADHFVRLASTLARAPGATLAAARFVGPDETVARGDTAPAPEVAGSVLRAFEARAAATPAAAAVVTDDETVSYAELDQRADRLAGRLVALGANPGSVVGVLLDRGPDVLAAFLAAWKAGAAYLPLDPGAPLPRAAAVLADAGAGILVTAGGGIPGYGGHVVAPGDAAAEPFRTHQRHDDLDLAAYVIYTSGSTGRPKGVEITHRALANHVEWAARELAAKGDGGAPVFSSVAFDLVVPNVWAPLVTGQATRMLPQDLDLAELGGRLVAGGPYSFVKLTPGHLDVISRQVAPEQVAALAAVFVVAGEALPPRLADDWARLLGPGRLINEYGPTEATVGALIHRVDGPVATDSVPIGRPLPGMRVHVLDEVLCPLPAGIAGELYAAGTGVARGYTGRPDLTAERFLPDPYGPPGSRMYRTGDRARLLPDGSIDFLGRADDQVKIRGYRVEPGEVAAVLAEHPQVRDAVVVADRAPAGNRLLAYVVPGTPDWPALHAALAEHCARTLPDYLVPEALTPIEAIPLTANGKLDRAALPAPETSGAEGLRAPSGIVEERVAEIFGDLLGAPVGADTHFFAAGGNSILAIRLIAEIQSDFDVSLPVRAVFESPTVAALAHLIEDLVRAEIEKLSPAELAARSNQQDIAGR